MDSVTSTAVKKRGKVSYCGAAYPRLIESRKLNDGAREQYRWHLNAERLGRLEVDQKFILGRLLHGDQVIE